MKKDKNKSFEVVPSQNKRLKSLLLPNAKRYEGINDASRRGHFRQSYRLEVYWLVFPELAVNTFLSHLHYLYASKDDYGLFTRDKLSPKIYLGFTREEWATRIGLTVRAVTGVINHLLEVGVIEKKVFRAKHGLALSHIRALRWEFHGQLGDGEHLLQHLPGLNFSMKGDNKEWLTRNYRAEFEDSLKLHGANATLKVEKRALLKINISESDSSEAVGENHLCPVDNFLTPDNTNCTDREYKLYSLNLIEKEKKKKLLKQPLPKKQAMESRDGFEEEAEYFPGKTIKTLKSILDRGKIKELTKPVNVLPCDSLPEGKKDMPKITTVAEIRNQVFRKANENPEKFNYSSLVPIWRQYVIENNPSIKIIPEFKLKEKAQFNQLGKIFKKDSVAIFKTVLSNWNQFTTHCEANAGAFKTPLIPTLGFLVKYSGMAVNYHAVMTEVSGSSNEKQEERPAPSGDFSAQSESSKNDNEENDEGAMSLEELLAMDEDD